MNIYTVELLTQAEHKPFEPYRSWLMDKTGLVFNMSRSTLEAKCRRELPDGEWSIRTLALVLSGEEKDERIAELEARYADAKQRAIIRLEDCVQLRARAEKAEADRDEAKRAGTPYAIERDAMNALVITEAEQQDRAETAEAERDDLKGKLEEALEALDDLMAMQNGPPLVAHTIGWNAAMTKGYAVLDHFADSSKKAGA